MSESQLIRFGEFEVDLCAWSVRKNGMRVALQRKPFQILRTLLSRPGELISRAELATELWPDLHVRYEHCLNTAMNALRSALNDPSRVSQFIETHPGLGYRFVGQVSLASPDRGASAADEKCDSELALGYYFLHRSSPESLARARACFTAAAKDSRHMAEAFIAMAELDNFSALCGHEPTRIASDRALCQVRAAMSIAPQHPRLTLTATVATALSTGNYEEAVTSCSALLETSQHSVMVHLWLSQLLCLCGRPSEAVEHLQIAKRGNPVSLLILTRLSISLYLSGHYPEAIKQAWAALSIESTCAEAQYALALSYQQSAELDDAITEFENAIHCSGGAPAPIAGLTCTLHDAGRILDAAKTATRLQSLTKTTYVSRCWQALAQSASGDRVSAEQSLALAAEEGDCLLGFARLDRRYKSLNHSSLAYTSA